MDECNCCPCCECECTEDGWGYDVAPPPPTEAEVAAHIAEHRAMYEAFLASMSPLERKLYDTQKALTEWLEYRMLYGEDPPEPT